MHQSLSAQLILDFTSRILPIISGIDCSRVSFSSLLDHILLTQDLIYVLSLL